MKRSILTMLAAVAIIAGTLSASGTTNYWDNNSDTAGFGTAGGTWGTDANWSTNSLGTSIPVITNTTVADELHFGTDTDGLATGTVTVDSTNQAFKTMTFGSASGEITIEGGELELAAPASTVYAYSPTNTINTALTGTNAFFKFGTLTFSDNYLQTTPAVIFPGATLADFENVDGYLGGGNMTDGPAEAFHFVNNGTNATVQLQRYDEAFLKCLLVEFTQVEEGIAARVVDARYVNKTLSNTLGYNFETQSYTSFTIATSSGAAGYGVAEVALLAGKMHDEFLTGTSSIIFTDADLKNYTGADGCMGGASVNDRVVPAQAYHFTNSGSTATFQLQIYNGGHTKCVGVELTQQGANIEGLVKYARYKLSVNDLGFNFDTGGSTSGIATSSSAEGYGAAKITLSRIIDNSTLVLSGRNSYSGDTTTGGGTLEIAELGQLGEGSYAGKISTGGKIHYNSSEDQTFSGAISGAGSLVKGDASETTAYSALMKSGFMPTTSTLLFDNANLSDYVLGRGYLGGPSINSGVPLEATIFYFSNDGETATFQMQLQDGNYIKCVKVEFTQVGPDIYGRWVYGKYVTGSELPYPDFDTSGNTHGYEAYNTTITTHAVVPAKLTVSGANTYTAGTVVNSGTLEVNGTTSSLPTSGGITVNEGGELLLNVPGDPGTGASVGGNNPITVNGGTLTINGKFNAGYSRSITINGGVINSTITANSDNSNYMNNITLMNGAQITGYKIRMGYLSAATITVSGTSASSIAAGINMVNNSNRPLTFNVADATGDAAADLSIPGVIKDYNTGGFANMPIIKSGAGTVSFSGANTHVGMITIDEGTLTLGADNTLNTGNPVVLSGGALDMGAFDNTVGTLTVDADSVLAVGAGAIAFADSSATTWSGTLSVTNTLAAQTVRFGTDDSALTSVQLSLIDIGGESAKLTTDGYLATLPAGTLIMIK